MIALAMQLLIPGMSIVLALGIIFTPPSGWPDSANSACFCISLYFMYILPTHSSAAIYYSICLATTHTTLNGVSMLATTVPYRRKCALLLTQLLSVLQRMRGSMLGTAETIAITRTVVMSKLTMYQRNGSNRDAVRACQVTSSFTTL